MRHQPLILLLGLVTLMTACTPPRCVVQTVPMYWCTSGFKNARTHQCNDREERVQTSQMTVTTCRY